MKHVATGLALSLSLLTAACGSSEKADGEGTSLSAGAVAEAGEAVSCTNLPAHVALPGDAKVSLCTQAEVDPGHRSGTVVMTTAEAPDAVIAFYKARAKETGIPDSIANSDPQPGMGPMYSARDGTKRSFMAITRPLDGGRTEVTLNWGADN